MAEKRILVVDDEQDIIDMLVELLVAQGYEVDSAATAEGALEQVRANIYDGAILDFNLPDMNGVMLHRQIRQMDSELADHTLFTSGLVHRSTSTTSSRPCATSGSSLKTSPTCCRPRSAPR